MGPTDAVKIDEINTLWNDCTRSFEEVIDKMTMEMVIRSARISEVDSDTVRLSVFQPWQREKMEKYADLMSEIMSRKAGRKINLSLETVRELKLENPAVSEEVKPDMKKEIICRKPDAGKNGKRFSGSAGNLNLNPSYTFDTFIVGSANRVAEAAARAVAEAPAGAYNPLFIYGGVGLGKTHLLNAIANKVKDKNPDARIVYVSAENFMNDMVESIQDRKMNQFRKKYRYSNVFLIDDIQFIKNKETMQEEFFHTFNELHAAKSQIVITSDRPPKNIPTLEDRLRSRFEWGLIADIKPPELETRIAILKRKAEIEKANFPGEVISFIAEKIPSNIRELEGAFNRVICYASLLDKKVDMDLAADALKEIIPDERPKNITISFIQDKVCEYFSLKMEDLLGSRRDSKLVVPRHIAMYLSRELTGSSLPNIGKSFGGRDHTTVLSACNNINKKMRDSAIRNDIENIQGMLKKCG